MAEVCAEEQPSFWSVAQRLQSGGQLCDIQLCVPSTDNPDLSVAINAHKVVLVASSLFFQNALQNGDLLDVYKFVGISQENLQLVVDYMYRRTPLEELLTNTEAAFAAQSIQLVNHYDDGGSVSVNHKGKADYISSTDREESRSAVAVGDDANHKNSCYEVKMGGMTSQKKNSSGDLSPLYDKGGESDCSEDSSRCMDIMVKQEPSEVGEPVDSDDNESCGDNTLTDGVVSKDAQMSVNASQKQPGPHLSELSEKLNRRRICSMPDGGQTSKPKPCVRKASSQTLAKANKDVAESTKDSSTVGSEDRTQTIATLAKFLKIKSLEIDSPQVGQSSSSERSNFAPVRNSKSILKSRNSSPMPSVPKSPCFEAVTETPWEILRRSSKRQGKTLDYKILAGGLGIELADKPKRPNPPSPPEQSLSEVSTNPIGGSDAAMVLHPASLRVKRKRGRPRKPADVTTFVVVAETGDNMVAERDGRVEMDGSIGAQDTSSVEAIQDDAYIQTGDNSSNITPVGPSQKMDIDRGDCQVQEDMPFPKRLKSTEADFEAVQCANCVRTFKSKIALAQHRKLIHGVKLLYGCTLCGMEEESMRMLEKHKKDVHKVAMYACAECALQFKTREGLKVHDQKKHSGETPTFKCVFCEKAFFFNGELKSHLQFHSAERNFQCDRCSRAFKSKSLLGRHMKTFHSNERNFKCDVCSAMFKTRNDCKAHRLKHFRIKNPIVAGSTRAKSGPERHEYPCQVCGKVFKKRSQQLVHENLQHKQKSAGTAYMCTLCSKVFPIRHYLMQHIKNCHSQRRFACRNCPQVFAQRGDLKKHETIAGRCKGPIAESKPFSCPHCHQGFSLKGNLSKHLQRPERCRSHPANPEVILVVASETTTDGAVGDVAEATTGEPILIVPSGEEGGSHESEETSTVQTEEQGGVRVSSSSELTEDNNVELQGLVDGKLVPISMTSVDGQHQFTITGAGDLNDTQVVYQVADTDGNNSIIIHVQEDGTVQESVQSHVMGDNVSGHILQDGEAIHEIVLQHDVGEKVIAGDDISGQVISDDINEEVIVSDEASGQVIVSDDVGGQAIASDDVSGQAIVDSNVRGEVIQLFEEGVLVDGSCEEQQVMESHNTMEGRSNLNEAHCPTQVQEVADDVASISEQRTTDKQLILDPVHLTETKKEATTQVIDGTELMAEVSEEATDELVEDQEVIHGDNVIYLEHTEHIQTELVDE